MTTDKNSYVSLDILRGAACLAVVIFHWQHFFEPGVRISLSGFPLSNELSLLYEKGSLAVDLFFGISGFVFFENYLRRIRGRSISFRTFLVLRATRLLPIHVAALIAVFLLQAVYLADHGHYFESQNNSSVDFIKQLFLINFWLPGAELSLNLPTWSLSIEVLVYIIFSHGAWFLRNTVLICVSRLFLQQQLALS